jgi:hypothetical protein
MRVYAPLLFLAIGAALAWMYFFLDRPHLATYPEPSTRIPHVYNGTSSIASIDLLVVYFVPKDMASVTQDEWRPAVKKAVDNLVAFHTVEFAKRSTIAPYIYETPIIGEDSSDTYDTNDTNKGNPAALRSIGDELTERLERGDLQSLRSHFKEMPDIYVVYEGVGSSGSPGGASLINRKFLTDPQYASYGTSYFVHEFYHTIGVPDGYNDLDQSLTSDIMGLGRRTPLEINFLSDDTLQKLGI